MASDTHKDIALEECQRATEAIPRAREAVVEAIDELNLLEQRVRTARAHLDAKRRELQDAVDRQTHALVELDKARACA